MRITLHQVKLSSMSKTRCAVSCTQWSSLVGTSAWYAYALVVSRTWILQTNPKLYNIDAALGAREIIYWRIPQYTGEVHASERALIWRSGKEAGFIA